ncbi:MAG: type II toxin-antitoxin system RelE/ParE family toxin [Patescibacteria group bacterium]|jgi:phage-related protein
MTAEEYRVVYYLKSNNRAPVEEYLKGLKNKRDVAKMVALVDKLREEKGVLPFPHAKNVEKKIWELRATFGGRVFYFITLGKKIVLLDGITKKSDRIPQKDLDRIREHYRDYIQYQREKSYD